jgi:hypothetical protein
MPATLSRPDRAAVLADPHDLKRHLTAARYAADVWTWVVDCVTTVDELDPSTPIKPFPTQVCPDHAQYAGGAAVTACPTCTRPMSPLAYLRDLARQWQSSAPPLLLIPKARRMRLTWLMVACHVWLACHRPHANVFFVSSKEDKSAELIERARGILARLPALGGGGQVIVPRASPPSLRLENGALLMGVAEGADQLRQYTATAILADEFGTWNWPRAAYTAMRPTIDGGGRLTLLSSAWPGTWGDMIKGEFLG